MKVVLATDAIHHPLTGIGRYAFELARGLKRDMRVGQCRYFSFGRFVENPEPPAPGDPGSAWRTRLAKIGPVVTAYRLLTPAFYWWRLRSVRDHLFHSPNFMLPPVQGPAVATVHDLSTFLYPRFHPAVRVSLLAAEMPKTLARATHLITDSEFTRREVISTFGWSEDRITAVPLGVDARYTPMRAEETRRVLGPLGLTHGRYLLCVSTVEPRKNIDTLLDAYLALPAALRERAPLVVAGSTGWHSDALRERMRDAAGQGVRYLDYIPENDLPLLYAGAATFALASFYEGFGLPVLEAMASGVPVVASNASSLPEVAGPDAMLLDPYDVDAWREAMWKSLDDIEWRERCIASGLTLARVATWQRCVTRTVDVYERALSG